MIKQLLSLSSQINRSSSPPETGSKQGGEENKSKKILSLQQFIHVNESLLDSIFIPSIEADPIQRDGFVSEEGVAGTHTNAFITVDDVKRVLVPISSDTTSDNTLEADEEGTNKSKSNESQNALINNEIKALLQKILQMISKPMGQMEKNSIDMEEEMNLCQSILLTQSVSETKLEYSEEQILMVVQYLLRLSSRSTGSSSSCLGSVLENIMNITYPLLLATPHYSLQLRDAIINATFSISSPPSKDTITSKQVLTSCLNLIQESISTILQITIQDARKMKQIDHIVVPLPEWITTVVEFSCRLLSRILDLYKQQKDSNYKDHTQSILDSIQDSAVAIMTSLCYYGFTPNSSGPLMMNGRTSSLLRIVTSLLLPCLLEQSDDGDNERRMLSLWDFIRCLIQSNSDQIDGNSGNGLKKCRTW